VNTRHPLSVMKLTFAKLLCSSRAAVPQSLGGLKGTSEDCWLSEELPYKSESNLSDDFKILRQLEAEIYTLNDQVNTVTENNGPLLS